MSRSSISAGEQESEHSDSNLSASKSTTFHVTPHQHSLIADSTDQRGNYVGLLEKAKVVSFYLKKEKKKQVKKIYVKVYSQIKCLYPPFYKIRFIINLEEESIPKEHQIWKLNDGRLPPAQWITRCRFHVSLKMKRWADKRTTKSLLKERVQCDRCIFQYLLLYKYMELPAKTMPPPPLSEIHPR